MSYLVGQRFSPLELVGPGGPPLAAMSDSVALARELELALEVTPVRLSNGFFDSVMAAIAAEPLPAPGSAIVVALRAGRPSALVSGMVDSWRVTWAGGRPVAVRLQGLAFVLVMTLAIAGLSGALLVGALGALQRGPSVAPVVAPESTQPARLNEQTPTETDHSTVKGPATPSERTPATPAVRSTPTPQPDWTPRPTATTASTEEPHETDRAEPTETPGDDGSSDASGSSGSGASAQPGGGD